MSVKVDACGLACPQPVIETKKALDGIPSGEILTIVDNEVAKENVVKFAVANQCGVCTEAKDGKYYIKITKGIATATVPAGDNTVPLAQTNRCVYVITQATLGHGNSELGAVLMKSFLVSLGTREPLPKTILFLNSGVQLTTEGSPVIDLLKDMSLRGVELASCGTCLDYYHLKEKLAVGTITNMYAIVEALSGPDKAITL